MKSFLCLGQSAFLSSAKTAVRAAATSRWSRTRRSRPRPSRARSPAELDVVLAGGVQQHVEPGQPGGERPRVGPGVVHAVRQQQHPGVPGRHPGQLPRRRPPAGRPRWSAPGPGTRSSRSEQRRAGRPAAPGGTAPRRRTRTRRRRGGRGPARRRARRRWRRRSAPARPASTRRRPPPAPPTGAAATRSRTTMSVVLRASGAGERLERAVQVDVVRAAAVRHAGQLADAAAGAPVARAAGARRAGAAICRAPGRSAVRRPRAARSASGSARAARRWSPARRCRAGRPAAVRRAVAGRTAPGPPAARGRARTATGSSVELLGPAAQRPQPRRGAARPGRRDRGVGLDGSSTGLGRGRLEEEVVLPDLPQHLPPASPRPSRRGRSGRTARRTSRRGRRRCTPPAARAVGRPTLVGQLATPRIAASCAATRVRSMAPRTLLPCRTSSCSRVARVSATASATSRRGRGQPAGAPADDAALGLRRPGSRSPAGTAGRAPRSRAGWCRRCRRGSSRRSPGTSAAPATMPTRGTAIRALGHRGEQRVQGVLRRPVELLDVEEAAARASPRPAARARSCPRE